MNKLILGMKGSGTLGDALWYTPVMKVHDNVLIQMHPDKQSREVAVVYNNIAQVEFTDNPIKKLYETTEETTHYAQRVLNLLNIKKVNCIPEIVLTKDEMDWAKIYLKEYNNPLIFINDNSGCHDPIENPRACYVRPPPEKIQNLVDFAIGLGYTPLQFGMFNSIFGKIRFTPLNNCVHIQGLNVRQLAACYHVIGKMISGDTGDYHLMLAVGGKCCVGIPIESHSFGYVYYQLLYFSELWKDEKIRVNYIQHEYLNNLSAIKQIFEFLN